MLLLLCINCMTCNNTTFEGKFGTLNEKDEVCRCPSCGWLCAYSGGKAIIHGQSRRLGERAGGRATSSPHVANVTPNMYSAWLGSWRRIMRKRQRMSLVKE